MDVTYNFTAGTRAVAQQVNQNFADVKSAVDPLQTAVADIESQLTSGLVLPDGSVDFTRLQSYKTYAINNATNATPIVITAVAHGFLTGDKVYISGVGGNTAANGVFTITKIGVDTFSLDGSVGNGAFSSNGTAVIVPVNAGNLINKAYLDNNAGALKTVNLGTITTGKTLATNTVSLANVTATLAITLPTTLVAGNENTVIFDFTTTASSQPTISTSGTLKWSDKNQGKAPTAYSTVSGVRNILVFKTHDGGVTWEAEYVTYGGVETTFTRPNLTANGTMGGTSFAISDSDGDATAYQMVDGSASTNVDVNSSTGNVIIYNPLPLKISNFNIKNRPDANNCAMSTGTIYGSNDGTTYTSITSFSNSVSASSATYDLAIPTANQNYYKYYKIQCATSQTSGIFTIAEIAISAIYIAT